MQKPEVPKLVKLPWHVLLLGVILVVFLALFTVIWIWYDHKIKNIKNEEQRLHKKLSALTVTHNSSYRYTAPQHIINPN